MRFDSLDYLLLLALTAGLFFRLGARARMMLLCAASLFFYAVWNVPLTSLILISAAVDFAASRAIEGTENQSRRRMLLAVSLTMNLGLLGFFKYSNFFVENLSLLTGSEVGGVMEVVLPPGISFYTFQTMSYTIDVYRRKIPAARSWWNYLVYVSFFPQLIAGPIERAGRILSQLEQAQTAKFAASDLVVGVRMIVLGLFKKVVIADHCGAIADMVYRDPEHATAWSFAVATYAFTLQIYCDFSAYSEIARGSARIFGIRLVRNFDQPYLVQNPSAFWRHWHISLSEWFRDYVYLALGGSRGTRLRTLMNLTVTMFLSGLWHGAAWNFVVWGFYHGVLLVAHQLTRGSAMVRGLYSKLGGLAEFGAWFLMFHLVVLGWVLFRIERFSDLGVLASRSWESLQTQPLPTAAEAGFVVFTFAFIAASWVIRRDRVFERLHADPTSSVLFYACVATLAILLGSPDGAAFIYFQF